MTNTAFHNLSNVQLSEQETIALSLGIKTWLPDRLNINELNIDLAKYLRRINLYDFYSEKEPNQAPYIPTTSLKLVTPNTSLPPDQYARSKAPRTNMNHILYDITVRVFTAFVDHKPRRRPAKVLRDAIIGARSLGQRTDIIVKPADKNLGITVMDKEEYRTLILAHLDDHATYERLTHTDIQPWLFLLYYRIVTRYIAPKNFNLKRILLERVPATALGREARPELMSSIGYIVPYFYGIPKVHKKPLALRPICSSHSFFSTPLAIWVNEHLLPIAKRLQTVCHSSADVAHILSRIRLCSADIVFVTGDVVSLYPNIDIDHALTLVSLEINRFHGPHLGPNVTKALAFCLRHHYVQFDDVFYLQKKGTAMGVQFAPSFANIYLYCLHQGTIFQQDAPPAQPRRNPEDDMYIVRDLRSPDVSDHEMPDTDEARAARATRRATLALFDRAVVPLAAAADPIAIPLDPPEPAVTALHEPPAPVIRKFTQGLFAFLRYIDDIFFVSTNATAERLMERLNDLHPSIKITWEKNKSTAVFLDINITRNEDKIDYKVYSKPSAMFLYAPFASHHPLHIKKGWITTEVHRFVRLSSSFSSFYETRQRFYTHLRARGYPARLLNVHLPKIEYHKQRAMFLSKTARPAMGSNPKTDPFVAAFKWSTFVQDTRDLRERLRPIPDDNRHRIERLAKKRVIIAYKTPNSIRRLVIRARFKR
jgi:hypothetical protein